MKVVLRMTNEDYGSEGDSKYYYLQENGETCDLITQSIGAAKIFEWNEVKNGIKVHSKDWKIVPLSRELRRIFRSTSE